MKPNNEFEGHEDRHAAIVREVGARIRSWHADELAELRRVADEAKLSCDPFAQPISVFRLFNAVHSETNWTPWMASLLRGEAGERCARLSWGALCNAIARRAQKKPPVGDGLALADDWSRAINDRPVVEDELDAGDLGRLDLFISTPRLVAVIENKIDADWHDRPDKKQADQYREYTMARRADRAVGLVLLAHRQNIICPPDYIRVDWGDFGRALRLELQAVGSVEPSEIFPLVQTLVAIERDLLGLRDDVMDVPVKDQIDTLTKLASYLRGD